MNRNLGDFDFVGQLNAESLIDRWVDNDSFPHFILIAGDKGSGRKSLAYLIAKSMGSQVYTISDVSVDSCRRLVETAYTVDSKILYLIPDCDGMSAAAKNSLLKLTEEPPENAYIVMTLQSLDNTLNTLRSRSQHIVMEPYSYEDMRKVTDNELISKIAKNPGMVKDLEGLGNNVEKFVDTCDKLVMYIDKVSIANALKSSNSIKFKESDKGYDLQLMLSGIDYVLASKMANNENLMRLSCWYKILARYRNMFNRPGVNKKAVYDKLIFDIRSLIRERQAK